MVSIKNIGREIKEKSIKFIVEKEYKQNHSYTICFESISDVRNFANLQKKTISGKHVLFCRPSRPQSNSFNIFDWIKSKQQKCDMNGTTLWVCQYVRRDVRAPYHRRHQSGPALSADNDTARCVRRTALYHDSALLEYLFLRLTSFEQHNILWLMNCGVHAPASRLCDQKPALVHMRQTHAASRLSICAIAVGGRENYL